MIPNARLFNVHMITNSFLFFFFFFKKYQLSTFFSHIYTTECPRYSF